MDILPIEIIRLISLELSPRYLSLVCKLYDTMYDDEWYYQYLIQRYDKDEIMGTDFSYGELCERSLSQGTIYASKFFTNNDKFDTKMLIQGIKCIGGINKKEDYVLTFNGKLYKCTDDTAEFIDDNVVDIDNNCYIKKSKLVFNNKLPSIDFSTSDQIKELQYICEYNECQFYTKEDLFYFDSNTLNKIIIADGIRKAYTIMRFGKGIEIRFMTYILTNKNTLLIYFNKNFSTQSKIINNVTDLGKNYLCRDNKYYYFYPYHINFKFNDKDFILFHYTINSSVSRHYISDAMILDKKFAWVTDNGIILNVFDYEIKKLMGNDNSIYIIKE